MRVLRNSELQPLDLARDSGPACDHEGSLRRALVIASSQAARSEGVALSDCVDGDVDVGCGQQFADVGWV
jgi:hypothetical protein